MVFGGAASERLQLNEDTLYAGGPYDPNNREALQSLPEARQLIFAGKFKEASDLIGAKDDGASNQTDALRASRRSETRICRAQ